MTVKEYFKDSFKFKSSAKILNINIEDAGKIGLILDQTIFHPQGGGQPSDQGLITSETGKLNTTLLVKQGDVIKHIGTCTGDFFIGQNVDLEINRDERVLNARLHSAGHLLDVAVNRVCPDLVPSKGYHFKDGPWVQYKGTIDMNKKEGIAENIQTQLNALIEQDIPVETRMDGSTRFVNFKGYEVCPCGGTHIESAKQLGTVTITQIKKIKQETKIKYCLE